MRHRSRSTRVIFSALAAASSLLTACGAKAVTDRSPKPDGVYEQFDVTRVAGGACLAVSQSEFDCPPGNTCAAPPPKPVGCPAGLTEGATVRLIMTNDLTCNVDGTPTPCPDHDQGPVEVPPEP